MKKLDRKQATSGSTAPESSSIAASNIVNTLTYREKIGQLMMLDFRYWQTNTQNEKLPMIHLPDTIRKIIHDYGLGSLILFRENLVEHPQIYQLTQAIQTARRKYPLFIATDQEGGIVTRLPSATRLPGNMALAATRNAEFARKSGEIQGRELAALGFNVNFAPVLDVNTDQENPVIGVRSYSSNTALIQVMSQAYIQGLQQQGILAIGKHFPGHGNVNVDSHVGLPIVPYSKEEWQKNDLPPFTSAMKNGLDGIMTAHVVVPALDNTQIISKQSGQPLGLPATLSKPIIDQIVRKNLHFEKLIFSDAMNMGAVIKHFAPHDAVKRALEASIDIVIMPICVWQPEDVKALEALFQFLESEAEKNPQFARRIDQAVHRVILTKLDQQMLSPLGPLNMPPNVNVVGCAEHLFFEKDVAKKAITLIKNNNVLPFNVSEDKSVLLISKSATINTIASGLLQEINAAMQASSIDLNTRVIDSTLPPKINKQICQTDYIILMTYNLTAPCATTQRIIDLAHEYGKPLVVIATRNPYDIAYLERVNANIAIYGITQQGSDQTNLVEKDDKSIKDNLSVNLLAGFMTLFYSKHEAPDIFNQPSGNLPVDIKSIAEKTILYPYGHGLTYTQLPT